MNTTRNISLEVALRWESEDAMHTDRRYFEKINLWRDYFPGDLGERLSTASVGENIRQDISAGELVPAFDHTLIQKIKRGQFNMHPRPGMRVEPHVGRFYPGTLIETSLYFRGDSRACRILSADEDNLEIDFNHPYSRYSAHIETMVVNDLGASTERGGRCNDIAQEIVARGPGMQAALAGIVPDFLTGDPFARLDPRDDAAFYAEARLVQHLDAVARLRIAEIYARFLRQGMRVLDLMSSWVSHLPEEIVGLHVAGLGMNAQELAANPRLSEIVVQDLNREPRLPYGDAVFDAAICTVSVEYLIHPIDVFQEVARVLKPGAPFVVTFSERWFPPKVIELWTELHAFERMGLVLDYFRRAGRYTGLSTESLRGLPRPDDDKYAGQMALSDPVYAVWGWSAGDSADL